MDMQPEMGDEFAMTEVSQDEATDEQLGEMKHVVTELARYEDEEHDKAMECWGAVRTMLNAGSTKMYTYTEVAKERGMEIRDVVRYNAYGDIYTEWVNK